jgi:hypothetical protein
MRALQLGRMQLIQMFFGHVVKNIFIDIFCVFSARDFLQLLDDILSVILKKKCSYNIFFLHLTSYFHYILKN